MNGLPLNRLASQKTRVTAGQRGFDRATTRIVDIIYFFKTNNLSQWPGGLFDGLEVIFHLVEPAYVDSTPTPLFPLGFQSFRCARTSFIFLEMRCRVSNECSNPSAFLLPRIFSSDSRRCLNPVGINYYLVIIDTYARFLKERGCGRYVS